MPRNPAPVKQKKTPEPKAIEEQPPAAVAVADVLEPVRPKTPPPPKRTVSEIVRLRAEEAAILVKATEEVLRAVAQKEDVSVEEHSLLVSVGLIGDRLDSEVRRMTRILSRQALAGTADDRERARVDAEQAAVNLAERGPTIGEEIQTLQAEMAGLESSAESTRQAVESQEEAVKTLRKRDFLPEHLKAEFDDLRAQIQTFSPKLQSLKGELAHTEVLAQKGASDSDVIDLAQQARLPCYQENVASYDKRRVTRTVDAAGWQQYIDERRTADEQRRVELDGVEAEISPLVEKQERLLSHYVL